MFADTDNQCSRTSMPSSWLTSSLPVSDAAILKGSGTMLPLPWASYSTRTRTSPSWCQRASSWCRVRSPRLSVPYEAIQTVIRFPVCVVFGVQSWLGMDTRCLCRCIHVAFLIGLMVLMFLSVDNTNSRSPLPVLRICPYQVCRVIIKGST